MEDKKTTVDVHTEKSQTATTVESQYQTVTVRRIREETIIKSPSNEFEEILKRIVPTKSFLYRHHNEMKKRKATSYVPMDVGKKQKKIFGLSYDYPQFDFSRFRLSRQEPTNFNDRGYYSVKTTTTLKNNNKTYKNVESRTKYKSFSNTEDFNEIVLEDHFYEDLCYNDVEKKFEIKRSNSTGQVNRSLNIKIHEIFNTFKRPFFKKDDARKGEDKDIPIYENNESSNSMYDSVIVNLDDVTQSKASTMVVEDYLEPIQLQKDYADVVDKEKEDSFLGYLMSMFENFGMRREPTEHTPEPTNVQPIQKWNDGKRGKMADRPLPVPAHKEAYYMSLDRSEAEAMLAGQPDGTFILRPSSQPNHAYTISVACASAVHNVGVRKRPDGKLALGFARRGERCFTSIQALIQHHQRRRLVLTSGGGVLGATALLEPPVYYHTPSSLPVVI